MVDSDGASDGAAYLPARASILAGGLTESLQQHGDTPYPVVDGIAVIEISGVLIHRGGWIGQSSGLTSYEGIAAQLQAALADPGVRGIALDIDSFGGEVAGAFDLAAVLAGGTTELIYTYGFWRRLAPPDPCRGRPWSPARRTLARFA